MRHLRFTALVFLASNLQLSAHAQSASHTSSKTAKSKTSAPAATQASDLVDAYLDQILCDNKAFHIKKEGLYRASKTKVEESEIRAAFSESIFYSLKPGQERSEFRPQITKVFSEVESITAELADVAVFYSSTLHELFEKKNKELTDAGKPTMAKDDFVSDFAKGALVLKTEGGEDYRDWLDKKTKGIEERTEKLTYGCSGNGNFIYRKGSRLGSVIDLDSFVIPATKLSAQKFAEATKQAEEALKEKHTKTPQAAALADKKPETTARAEEIYQPSTKPKVVRAEAMVGATFYYIPNEDDARYAGSQTRKVFDPNGNVISKVSASFYNKILLEGSGILSDGRTVNYYGKRGGIPRFEITRAKYGLGHKDNALKPWRSLAVDASYYARRGITLSLGQQIFIPSTYGLKIPGTNKYHDGMWEVADIGGKIEGARIDMFTGTMHEEDVFNYVKNSANYNDGKAKAESRSLGSREKLVTMKILR